MSRTVEMLLSCLLGAVLVVSIGAAQDKTSAAKSLRHVDTIVGPHLRGANHIAITAKGEHVYVTSWQEGAICVYKRDSQTGKLTEVQKLKSTRDFAGVTCMVLSPDNRYAVASAFQSKTVVLMSRDAETGKLRYLDAARDGDRGVRGLSWSIHCCFSPSGKHVYVCDPKHAGVGDATEVVGSITAFEITPNKKLKWVQTNSGKDASFVGTRAVTAHPNRDVIFATAQGTKAEPNGRLVVLDLDPKTGKTSSKQTFNDNQGRLQCFQGATKMTISKDGQFVYVSVGRFYGEQGIAVFQWKDGAYEFLEQHQNDVTELHGMRGCNALALSPDGESLFLAGTLSSSLASFSRDVNTGRLTYVETLTNGEVKGNLEGAAGVAVSPDSKHVYVAAEFGSALTVYERATAKP